MKTVILTLLCFILGMGLASPVYSGKKPTINTTIVLPDSSVVSVPEVTKTQVYNDVKAALVQLSAALQVSADHVYKVLVRQQRVEAITALSTIGSLFLISILTLIWLRSNDGQDLVDKSDGVAYLLFIIPFVLTLCVCLFFIDTVMTGFFNPEYGALKEILRIIR